MNKKTKVFDVDQEGFVKTLVGVLNTTPQNGILVAFDEDEPVGYTVAFDDSPTYGKVKEVLVWALYVKPRWSKVVAPMIMNRGVELARAQGYQRMKAFNSRFSGASFKFFEQLLGMRRSRIQFNFDIQ